MVAMVVGVPVVVVRARWLRLVASIAPHVATACVTANSRALGQPLREQPVQTLCKQHQQPRWAAKGLQACHCSSKSWVRAIIDVQLRVSRCCSRAPQPKLQLASQGGASPAAPAASCCSPWAQV